MLPATEPAAPDQGPTIATDLVESERLREVQRRRERDRKSDEEEARRDADREAERSAALAAASKERLEALQMEVLREQAKLAQLSRNEEDKVLAHADRIRSSRAPDRSVSVSKRLPHKVVRPPAVDLSAFRPQVSIKPNLRERRARMRDPSCRRRPSSSRGRLGQSTAGTRR